MLHSDRFDPRLKVIHADMDAFLRPRKSSMTPPLVENLSSSAIPAHGESFPLPPTKPANSGFTPPCPPPRLFLALPRGDLEITPWKAIRRSLEDHHGGFPRVHADH